MATLAFASLGAAQGLTLDANITATQMAELIVETSHFTVSNASFTGATDSPDFDEEHSQVAKYTNGGNDLFAATGLVMSTGPVSASSGPNNSPTDDCTGSTDINEDMQQGSDADFEAIYPVSVDSNDSAILEFDIVPAATVDDLTIQLIFASDEYDDQNGNDCIETHSDGCAIFITPENESTVNVAKIGNDIITVGTVYSGSSWYENLPSPGTMNFSSLAYNGVVKKVIHYAVTPGKEYHVKIVVADIDDAYFDSALIWASNSFQH